MNYSDLAKVIIKNVGTKENILSLTHCATRLRFNLKDDSKANTDVLKGTKGVMGVVNKGGQYQVIIGSDVANVYKEIIEIANIDSSDSNNEEANRNAVVKVLDTIAGIFTPIIPAITGAGMLKAVMALLVSFKVISTTSQTYSILNFMADAAFYFLPFLLANSAAKKFKCNPYMALTLAGVLLHPNFTAMMDAAKKAGEGISFLGLPVTIATYSSSVIPIILGVWFMSFVEPIADKVSPNAVKFFTKPLITLVVTGIASLVVLGPIGNICGNGISAGIEYLNEYANWLVPLIVGTFSPLLVMTGMHYGLIPIGINNLATAGFDTVVGPGMLGSNIAQGVAIIPEEGRVVAPVNGVISAIFETKHAIGITSEDGAELLIHIGIDTVNLKGKYFNARIKEGDSIKVGDLLVEFNKDSIIKEGYEVITPVIVTNSAAYTEVIGSTLGTNVKEKDKLINIIK